MADANAVSSEMAIVGKLRNILPWCQRAIFSLGICGHKWVVSFCYLCCV